MTINCVWEHNGGDTLLYAANYIGAYTRGESLDIAKAKMPREIASWCRWSGADINGEIDVAVIEEKKSDLAVCDADSDVIFESERAPLTPEEYEALRDLALKSASDFSALYGSVSDKNAAAVPQRKTFYGQVPRTANEIYEHTKNVNAYYFGEIGVECDNGGNVFECRKRGFEALERQADFLQNAVTYGSFGEYWSLRKVLRRFVWHDRIHAKAMWRTAVKLFSAESVADPFCFL